MNAPLPSGANLRVLVADDIESSRLALADLVRSLGHTPLMASDGEEALRCIEQEKPDLVLLDLLMPKMNGFEVAQQVQSCVKDRWLPIIVTSSLQGEDHVIEALAKGADDYLARPVSFPLLRAKLSHYQRVLSLQENATILAQRQQAIHEHIPDAIITIDSSLLICDANIAAKTFFKGRLGGELVGLPLQQATGMVLDGLSRTCSLNITGHDGKPHPCEATYSHWEIGTQSYCTITLHDLTEVRRIERMKDEFLSTVSHELRTPLTSVLGVLGILASGSAGELSPAAQKLTALAQRNGDRLNHLIDNVLDLTKLEGNRMLLQLRDTELEKLLNEAVAANEASAQSKNIRLYLEVLAEAPRAMIDTERFLQIMNNLLSNAIKFSPAKEVVTISVYGDAVGWRIDIIDKGPGIDPGVRERLFDKFSLTDSSDQRPQQSGAGLGLYISRLLIERMGGSISVHSQPSQGSTFSLLIPAHTVASVPPWILCISKDHQHLSRLNEWLMPLAHIETATDAKAAHDLLVRLGPPAVLVADPLAQGSADAFCENLSRIKHVDSIVLTGDSIDEVFAHRHGMLWISLADGARQKLVSHVHAMISLTGSGDSNGKT